MVLEDKQISTFAEWIAGGSGLLLVVLLTLLAAGLFIGYLVAALRYGPGVAIARVASTIGTAIKELFEVSPRRVGAMTTLAFREAIRRKVLVVFGVFLAVLLFAGWFLDPGADHPARLYLSFVLTATNYLIVMLAVFLSTFSLPNDVKNKTIYTVVTKPVRPWEIVLGRILGFTAIGTILLAVMCLVSYFFVVRGLSHEHLVDKLNPTDIESVEEGQTTRDNRHRHDLTKTAEGYRIEANHDHTHPIEVDSNGEVSFGQGVGNLQARVPKYGKLRFLDRDGKLVDKGVNVGNEWAYRSYVEGGTPAAAIWTFEGLKQTDFKDGIPLEMLIRVFRTYKGDIERGIFGKIQIVEPADTQPGETPKRIENRNRYEQTLFTAREFTTDTHVIPFKAKGTKPNGEEVDEMLLFQDLVSEDGKLEVWIQCGERAQYFGMAQGDVYIRSADGFFWANFLKGFLGIWFQMVIVTAFAVMFSTFLNGAVSMLATVAAICLGYFANFVMGLYTGDVEGGGPTEAMVRMFTQKNVIIPLEDGVTTQVIKGFDFVTTMVMAGICTLLPDYGGFNTSDYVAYGFDIQNSLVLRHFIITLIYVTVLTTVGYFFLKTREIAA